MNPNQGLDTWLSADPYERYMGRWSRQLAPKFLAWLRVAPACRWLDVGCGTGALSHAILDACAPASVIGIDPSEGFLARAQHQLGDRVVLRRGTANAITLADGAVDAAVSALVLNFVPDPLAALREMARVTATDGIVGVCVWDYAQKMELIRVFWDAAAELDPRAADLDEGARFPLCHLDALAEHCHQADLQQVEVTAIEIPTLFASFDDYWLPFLGGQGPAPTYATSLGEPARERLREHLHARLSPRPDGTIALVARAWAARGTVAR